MTLNDTKDDKTTQDSGGQVEPLVIQKVLTIDDVRQKMSVKLLLAKDKDSTRSEKELYFDISTFTYKLSQPFRATESSYYDLAEAIEAYNSV